MLPNKGVPLVPELFFTLVPLLGTESTRHLLCWVSKFTALFFQSRLPFYFVFYVFLYFNILSLNLSENFLSLFFFSSLLLPYIFKTETSCLEHVVLKYLFTYLYSSCLLQSFLLFPKLRGGEELWKLTLLFLITLRLDYLFLLADLPFAFYPLFWALLLFLY